MNKTHLLIILSLCLSSELIAQSLETLKLDWSGRKEWKEVYQDEQSNVSIVEYVRKGEDLTNWTEMVVVQTIRVESTQGASLEHLVNSGHREAQKNAPDAKLTLLGKDETAEHRWIDYTVEVAEYLNDPNPESQYFRLTLGEETLFMVWWATRKDHITEAEIANWRGFFDEIEVR